MSSHEYENDYDDDRYESADHDDHDGRDDDRYEHDDDRYFTSPSTGTTGTIYTDNDSDSDHYTNTSTGTLNGNYVHGYQFTITNGAVTGIAEIEHGYTQHERIEYGETWSVNGNQVVKTETEHGFIQTSVYADTNGDGVYTKISQTYTPSTTSTTSNAVALNSIQGGSDTDDNWTGTTASDNYYGSVGDDELYGGNGDDNLYGGNDNDDLHGDDGDDHLYGSNGDDHLYGGNGSDDANYEGNYAEYALLQTSTVIQLADSNELRDGTDTLESIERVHFADVSLALDTDGVAGEAYRLYKAAFDRESDDSGLGYWIAQLENGSTINDVANAFVGSDEFQHLYGVDVSDECFVNLLYNNVLDRDADEAGYAFWLNALDTTLSRADVLVNFSESIENQNNVAELIATGITYQEWVV